MAFLKKYTELISFVIKLGCFVLVLFLIFNVIFGLTTMTSDCMEPNISYHSTIIYSRMNSKAFLKECVLYEVDGQTYIGRVVGTPGDHIRIDEQGCLFQNEHLVYEENIYRFPTIPVTSDVLLGENEYYILCDNRNVIDDSRTFGAISQEQILGTIVVVVDRFNI